MNTLDHPLPLTPDGVARIRRTWEHLADARDAATQLFLDRLAELVPGIEGQPISEDQRSRALAILTSAILALDAPDGGAERLAELGRLAASAGLTAVHHALITAAILWTLEEGLGAPLPAETRRAWAAFTAAVIGHATAITHQSPEEIA